MTKGRLEAFSDGVLAIAITVMVLEMKPPAEAASWSDLKPIAPLFASYVLSFVYLGIYWNNHHHMFQVTRQVTGAVLWANLHLLFWLSLIPFTTAWMGRNFPAPDPIALYGGVLLMSAIAYYILEISILRAPGGNEILAEALGADFKGKASIALYVLALGLCFVNGWLAIAIYVLVALIWLIPDPRIERAAKRREM